MRVKAAQRVRRPGGLIRVLTDSAWTEWLPIYAWLIEHPEGLILVDTGETSKTSLPGYFPRWHPYYRFAVDMDVSPEEEIGRQLRRMDVAPDDVGTVVLTHLHTDHSGGLHHFPRSRILVSGAELADATGVSGRLQGYLPDRWPDWFRPIPLEFVGPPIGPFETSHALVKSGDVCVVPTPGHTPGHVSVIVRRDGVNIFLAGDTSYLQELLLSDTPDGVSPRKSVTLTTMRRIRELAGTEPTVYLPSHDPRASQRLSALEPLSV